MHAGFTTMGDMNSRTSYLTVDLRNAINRGIVKGPRLQVAARDRPAGWRGRSGTDLIVPKALKTIWWSIRPTMPDGRFANSKRTALIS